MPEVGFAAEEFVRRRGQVIEAIGPEAIGVLQGADSQQGSGLFRQYNEFYYLTGIEVAHAYLVMDGRRRRSILLLPRASQIEREHDGPVPSADNADYAKGLSGVDEVRGPEGLAPLLAGSGIVYTPLRHGQGAGMTYGTAATWYSHVLADPWDARPDRPANFVAKLTSRFPGRQVRDLTGTIEAMRLIKSPREIELMRRAGLLTAAGVCEAMRSTAPGVMEYQLEAVLRYHYVAGGGRGPAYHAIVAGGANAWHGHYMTNDCPLRDGDWVLCDCAPDYQYYTSDIGRMWPVGGAYSPAQRQLYGFVVEYHKVLLEGIRPGRTCDEIHAEAAGRMAKVLAGWSFSSPAHEAGARQMLEFKGHLSHSVGMCVHDGSGHRTGPLRPGVVFSVDPQMRVPEERLYIRVEDTVVVTDDGIENLTKSAPLELDDVEQYMRGEGMLQAFPPV